MFKNEPHPPAVEVYLVSLEPNSVQVEPYADRVNGGGADRVEMMGGRQLTEPKRYIFNSQMPTAVLATDDRIRVISPYDGLVVSLEELERGGNTSGKC